jgi:Tfp pilus assembly protein PilX
VAFALILAGILFIAVCLIAVGAIRTVGLRRRIRALSRKIVDLETELADARAMASRRSTERLGAQISKAPQEHLANAPSRSSHAG